MKPGGATRGSLPVAPPPAPADVGLVVALPVEVAPLVLRMVEVRKYAAQGQTILEGKLGDRIVALVQTGMGRARAERGARRLLDGHRPRRIISAGFAGGLDPDLDRGTLLCPVEVANVEGRVFATPWPRGLPLPPGAENRGRLLTVDEVVLKAEAKAGLRRAHAADLVDMETSAVAAFCQERGVEFLPVRVVSDDARSDLPSEILSIMGESGSYRIGAAVGAIWRRPASLKEMLRLRDQANSAAAILSKALLTLI